MEETSRSSRWPGRLAAIVDRLVRKEADERYESYDALIEAGADQGLRPTGIGVYGATGRIEKGYRLMGAELESEYNPVEAGLARPKVKAADFIGKEALRSIKAFMKDAASHGGQAPGRTATG